MTMRASLTGSLGCVLVLVAAAASASAQERWPGARRAPVRRGAPDEYANVGLEFSARVFGAAPSGMAIDPGNNIQGPSYSDLFRTGVGAGIAGYVPFYGIRAPGFWDEMVIGPMFAVDRITYAGQRDTDAVGDSLAPDDLDITRLLFGAYLRLRVGAPERPVRFHLGAQMAFGPAWINRVPAELALTGSGFGVFNGTLYDATTTFAFELSGRVGISVRLSPGVDLSVMAILGFNVVGAPEDADGPGNPIGPANAQEIVSGIVGLSLAVTIRLPR